MHISTIVKVKADNPEEAVAIVKSLVTCNGEYNAYNTPHSAFDWCDEEAVQISKEVKTEEDFQKLRKEELSEYRRLIDKAEEMQRKGDTDMQGYYLIQAGELLEKGNFWCYSRLAYDLSEHSWDGEGTEGKTFYVETDRHY